MNNNEIKNKLRSIASDKPSDWLAKAKLRKENREWLDRSAKIAINILRELRVQKLTQKDLSEKLQVSPQYINKIVKGQENLSLETIVKLEKALGISLVSIIEAKSEIPINQKIGGYDLTNSHIYRIDLGYQVFDYIPTAVAVSKITISEHIESLSNYKDNITSSDTPEKMQRAA